MGIRYIRLSEFMKTLHTIPAAKLFRAFADPTRLRILCLLRTGELCVCDLVAVLGLPQPTVSRHLAYLRGARLVSSRRSGTWAYYRLAPTNGALQRKLLGCLETVGEMGGIHAADARRLAVCNRQGCCDAT